MNIFDLFAGTGAFSHALMKILPEATVVFANDIDASSQEIYKLNSSATFTLKSLHDIDVLKIPNRCDILTGGFPCQPFSIAGLREGFKDPRSNVFWKMLDIIQTKMPRFLLLENVKNLQTHENGRTFETIKSSLENLGYTLVYKVLNTAKITGIPQHRERIYIVCFRDKEDVDENILNFPNIPKRPISDFIQRDVSSKYYYTERSKIWPLLSETITQRGTIYQFRRVYVRENKSGECPTLTANMGTGGHNVPLILDQHGIRKLTPRECFRFQGFPEDFALPYISDSKLYKLAGNAISYPIAVQIAQKLKRIISKNKKK